MGFFVNGMLGGYGALISELYPTAARATAQNVLFNIGRAVGGFGPVVVGAMAARLFVRDRDRAARGALRARHPGDVAPDPGAPRRRSSPDRDRRTRQSCRSIIQLP